MQTEKFNVYTQARHCHLNTYRKLLLKKSKWPHTPSRFLQEFRSEFRSEKQPTSFISTFFIFSPRLNFLLILAGFQIIHIIFWGILIKYNSLFGMPTFSNNYLLHTHDSFGNIFFIEFEIQLVNIDFKMWKCFCGKRGYIR